MIDPGKITRPALILDENICRRNIRIMADKARRAGVQFRPHFKTHQSPTIGKWFTEEGVNSITVSSAIMARHFAITGNWESITIAFPCNLRELDLMADISRFANLNLMVSGDDHTDALINHCRFGAGCFIKVNTGLNRSGAEWNDYSGLARIADRISHSEFLKLKGFLTHAGHTYKAGSADEIISISRDSIKKMVTLRNLVKEPVTISIGDTPGCSLLDEFNGTDEIRPGNFVFYDLTQLILGSCSENQIALAVACPVVEKTRKRGEVIIYGGGVHLSKESKKLPDGRVVFGQAVHLTGNGWVFPDEPSYLVSLSQEHGIISCTPQFYDSVKIGELTGIIPVHSCMTADLLREYHTFDGEIIADFSPK